MGRRVVIVRSGHFPEIHNSLVLNHGADGRVLRFEHRRAPDHLDGVADVPHLHREVEPRHLANLKFHTLSHGAAKPGKLGP